MIAVDTRKDVCQALRNLFGLPNVRLENTLTIAQAIAWHEDGLDFADALHLSHSQNCTVLYTFDQQFINRSVGMSNTEIKHPSTLNV
jgi:predicted nucleic acid-binding protein